jgi:hypothetical protein
MVVKFRNTIWLPPPKLSLRRRAALSSNSNGTRSVYSRENPKSSLYCEMSVVITRPRFFTILNLGGLKTALLKGDRKSRMGGVESKNKNIRK